MRELHGLAWLLVIRISSMTIGSGGAAERPLSLRFSAAFR